MNLRIGQRIMDNMRMLIISQTRCKMKNQDFKIMSAMLKRSLSVVL